jgi:hypothetical protein
VAALFALADEVTIEPELVDRWRASSRPPRSVSADEAAVTDLSAARMVRRDDGDDEPDVDPEAGEFDDDADHSDGGGRGADVIELRVRHDPELDVIGRLLQAPAGASPPSFPDVAELDHGVIRNRLLADVLNDALDHLAIRWE